MNARSETCDPRRLRRLADDRLSDVEVKDVQGHLEDCPNCRAALDAMTDSSPWIEAVRAYLGPDLDPDPTGPHDHDAPPIDDILGSLTPSDWPESIGRLGTYEVRGVIGRGGMGVVLKAFDPALHRNVAIKVLSPHLAGNGPARRRFLREARAAAAVAHEHVVSVFAVVESAGPPFLVMEYVPGGSLQDRLDRDGPMATADVLRIARQTAAGLAAAHAQGLVHRDVKPANILLENGIERVKLTDFGLARAAADASMTQSGLVVGTPHYMAPEQARAEATDHRADLFSLGSTIYAMCTGVPPFRAESPIAVVRRVADDEPRSIRELSPEVPAWLEAIVERLHAKDPADRFASASDLADLLGRCLAHVQQPMREALPRGWVPRNARRRQRLASATLAAPILAGMALVGWSQWGHRPSHQPPPARLATVEASDDSFREATELARRIESDLHRSAEDSGEDQIAAIVRDLSGRAEALGRELAPVVPPSMKPVPRSPRKETKR